MNMRDKLRENVDRKHVPKQLKYMTKLLKRLEKESKRGYYSYEIIPYYMPKWFDYDFKCGLIHLLQEKGFEVDIIQRRHELGTLYNVIKIKW